MSAGSAFCRAQKGLLAVKALRLVDSESHTPLDGSANPNRHAGSHAKGVYKKV